MSASLARLMPVSTMVLVLVVILMLIIPLPPFLLSVLILANLSLSLIVTGVATTTPKPLDFSSFPSLLLLTTLFRLALSVSTARLILLDANAGSVIQAFGQFVVGGNPIVGFLLFLLLFVVQFLVITKGAERVSEVAARFTLDAMPGKQMAIDADLHAGILSETEARERRREIGREADFYGAMDGASKFVRGDAIATLVILIINVVGGLLVGLLQHGMSLTTALATYTILSIGDAIASQLPALLLSTATGIVVTRSGAAGDVASSLIRELLFRPEPIYVVAGLIAVLGVFTPVGIVPALALAAGLVFLGSRVAENQARLSAAARSDKEKSDLAEAGGAQEPRVEMPDAVTIEFGFGLLGLVDPARGGDLLTRVTGVRRTIAQELGFLPPPVRIRDNVALGPQAYAIRLRGSEAVRGELMSDRLLALSVPEGLLPGISTKDPVFGMDALWISPSQRDAAQRVGATVVEPSAALATHLSETLRRHAHELFRREDAKAFLDRVRVEDAAVLEELTPQTLPLGTVHRVLANLLREGVGIQDGVTICEALADGQAVTREPEALTEIVRQALGRAITHRVSEGERLVVVTLDPTLEQELLGKVQRTDRGSLLMVDPAVRQRLTERVRSMAQTYLTAGRHVGVLTTPLLRPHIRRLLERGLPEVPVLSYGEIDPEAEVESAGTVSLA